MAILHKGLKDDGMYFNEKSESSWHLGSSQYSSSNCWASSWNSNKFDKNALINILVLKYLVNDIF